MANKRYDPLLKQEYDEDGKRLTNEILKDVAKATLITDNLHEDAGNFSKGCWDQQYQMPNGKMILVESEMKNRKWWGESNIPLFGRPFMYESIDIPFRKQKNKAELFLVISTCGEWAFVLTRKNMMDHFEATGAKPKCKRTIHEPYGGDYFSTPVDKGFFVRKVNGKWRRWKTPSPKSNSSGQ